MVGNRVSNVIQCITQCMTCGRHTSIQQHTMGGRIAMILSTRLSEHHEDSEPSKVRQTMHRAWTFTHRVPHVTQQQTTSVTMVIRLNPRSVGVALRICVPIELYSPAFSKRSPNAQFGSSKRPDTVHIHWISSPVIVDWLWLLGISVETKRCGNSNVSRGVLNLEFQKFDF